MIILDQTCDVVLLCLPARLRRDSPSSAFVLESLKSICRVISLIHTDGGLLGHVLWDGRERCAMWLKSQTIRHQSPKWAWESRSSMGDGWLREA